MKISKFATALTVGVTLALADAYAVLVTYGSEAAFDAAAPGTAVQDFSAGTGGNVQMANPLNSSTATASTGPILAGLEIAEAGPDAHDLVVLAPGGYGNNLNRAVFANHAPVPGSLGTLNISFASGQTAVGLGLLSLFLSSTFTLSVYDTSNNLLGSFGSFATNTGAANTVGTFWGVTASGGDLISRINLSSDSFQAEGVDLIKFGGGSSGVPDGGTTIILVGLAMGSLAVLRRKVGRV